MVTRYVALALSLGKATVTDGSTHKGPIMQSFHFDDAIMWAMASQITSLTFVYSTINSGTDQRKQQSSASLAFVRGIHRSPVNSPHKGPVTRQMFPFDYGIMLVLALLLSSFWKAHSKCYRFETTLPCGENQFSWRVHRRAVLLELSSVLG